MSSLSGEPIVVRLSRTIPATLNQVYRAWLDPEVIKRWMAPGTYEATQVEVDERVGGRYRIWHSNAGKVVGGFECEILELVPDRRIVWRWGFAGPDRTTAPIYDSKLHITLHKASDGNTLLEFVHEQLDDLAAAMPEVAEKVEAGWDNVLTKLNVILSAAPHKSSASAERRKPLFTETMQIGIVVRDLDAAIRRYEDDYGIGPWQSHQFQPGEVKEWREEGRLVEGGAKTRFAAAMVGQVQWELIQPLDDTSTFAKFLAEKGEGVHHIAVRAPDYEQTLAAEADRGNELIMSCELGGQFSGIKVAYLGTQPTLGVILEVFSGLPNGKQKADAD